MQTKTTTYEDYISTLSQSDGFKILCDLVFTSTDTFEVLDDVEKKEIHISSDDINLFYEKILNNTDNYYKLKVEQLIDNFLTYLKCYEIEIENKKKMIVWGV